MVDHTATVERPIFIIGTGRSGTTLFFEILSNHPSLAWPCQYMVGERLRGTERLVNKLAALPGLRDVLANHRYRRRPVPEPYPFWRRHSPGFARPVRDLDARDVPPAARRDVYAAFGQQLAAMRRPRFLTKYTGWSRIRFIDAIFPDALYVNVVRDGRAVAWSLLNVDWWHGWHGPNLWRWGPLTAENQEIWDRSDRSFLVLAGLHWKILMENLTHQGRAIGSRYLEVRYEDLTATPERVIAGVLEWAGLADDPGFRAAWNGYSLRSANSKWNSEVDRSQQQVFEQVLGPALARYGYGAESGDCLRAA